MEGGRHHPSTKTDKLKHVLTTAPILAYPDFTVPFELYVDASLDGIGVCLGQHQNGKEVAIAYAKRDFTPAERNYSATEREALALIESIKHFQTYLYGKRFIVYTDCHALRWLMSIKDPTGRLARWSLLVQQYDYEIRHRPGKANANTDALSRRPYNIAALDSPGLQTEQIKQPQHRDPELADILRYLQTKQLPEDEKNHEPCYR